MNRRQRRAQSKTAPAPQPASANIQRMFEAALQKHQASHLAEAESLYRQVLALDERHADALQFLGVLAHQVGRNDVAVDLIGKAIEIDGVPAHYRSNLGLALKELGRLEEAATSHRAAIRLKPDYPEAHSNLGIVLKELGRFDDAATAYKAAIRIRPDYPEAHSNLGNALRARGHLEEAVAAYKAALCLKPSYPEAYANLGAVLKDMRKLGDAVAACQIAIRLRPAYAGAHSALGTALFDLGRIGEAVLAYKRAIQLKPDHVEAYSNLGMALKELGHIDEAIAAFETAIRLKPDFAEAHSNLLLSLHYKAGVDAAEILAKARRFGDEFERRGSMPSYPNDANSEKRLRVGYVSGDFRQHPVGTFLLPVMANHDPEAVEIFCYSNNAKSDDITAALRAAAGHWRSLVGLSDEAAAAMIASDAIDILVDLSGHTANNRLPLFARKPAPVQAAWLGFWGTTGLTAMDYILTDAVTAPSGDERYYTEKLVRLPGGRFCYAPPDYAPEPALPPCLNRAGVTFGSFNNIAKIGTEVIELWAQLLQAVPSSNLLLKWQSLSEESARRRLVRAFAEAGIAEDRLILRGWSPHEAMLSEYGDIDIALDPFPFSGGLTSCEALWMGVPVVTLPNGGASSRQTAGYLDGLGAREWIASSPAGYIEIAATLASDRQHLKDLRGSLRQRMKASPLCDGPGFAHKLEFAYRALWREWCRAFLFAGHQ